MKKIQKTKEERETKEEGGTKKRNWLRELAITLIALAIIVAVVKAGSLTPPGAPSPTMKTLSEISSEVLTRSSHTAQDVWGATTRTLSSFGTLVSDIWNKSTSELTDTTKVGGLLVGNTSSTINALTGTYDASSITADANGNILEQLKYLAGPPLPHTGISLCYDTDGGDPIDCGDADWPNQDGDNYRSLSYTNNGCGTDTVKDNITGLCWQKKGDTADEKTWQNALKYCDDLSLGDYDDGWRLPNVKELQSIVNYSKEIPSIDQPPFTNTQLDPYWSSTTSAGNPDRAWNVDFTYGDMVDNYKTRVYFLRCVRAGG